MSHEQRDGHTSEAELRAALEMICTWRVRNYNQAEAWALEAAITELVALRADVARLAQHECDDQREIGELTLLNAELRADVDNLARNEREDQRDISALTLENTRLREQVRRLTDQHGTFPYMGYKSELKGL